jgi:hypothetical protein
MLRPYPKTRRRTEKRRTRSKKASLITSSPFKNQLVEQVAFAARHSKRKIDTPSKSIPVIKTSSARRQLTVEQQTVTNNRRSASKHSKAASCPKKKTDECSDYKRPGCDEKYEDPPTEDWIQSGAD